LLLSAELGAEDVEDAERAAAAVRATTWGWGKDGKGQTKSPWETLK
jgi:hypothetical protein